MNVPTFQQYQAEFTAHIRNPGKEARPQGVNARRMNIYTEIVFNNMSETLSACFPVSKKVLGTRKWVKLVRAFFIHHRCTTPLFRKIPEEFIGWLQRYAESLQDYPAFLFSLAHYEWVELAISVLDTAPANYTYPMEEDALLTGQPILTSALALLEYAYPVHRISPRFKPIEADIQSTLLLVYRNTEDAVKFIEVNAVTMRLMKLIQEGAVSGLHALQQIAKELEHTDPTIVINFGSNLLKDLHQQGVILGTLP